MIRRFARPYAKAMMDIVKSPQDGRKLHDELLGFERARSSSRELAELFATPAIDAEKKVAVARAIATRIELSELSSKLVDVLVRHHLECQAPSDFHRVRSQSRHICPSDGNPRCPVVLRG